MLCIATNISQMDHEKRISVYLGYWPHDFH